MTTTTRPGGGTIFEVIAREHRAIEAQFAHIQELGAAQIDLARSEFATLAHQLLAYLSAKAVVLDPRLGGSDLLDHTHFERTIGELRLPLTTSSEWLRAVRRLEAEVEHHVEHAERDVFPRARRSMTEEEAQSLARDYLAAEERAG